MTAEDTFRIRLGRISAPDGSRRMTSFAGKVRRRVNRMGRSGGARKTVARSPRQALFTRRVMVKLHYVKMGATGVTALKLHTDYIQRDGAGQDQEKGLLYSANDERSETDISPGNFLEKCKDDRHHFRIIVSPEDSRDLVSLTDTTRGLMRLMEQDMETRLDWVAVNHHDTATPHTHIILRGVRDDSSDLVIPRKYIAYGLRSRAEELITLELGPMQVKEASLKLARQVTQERLTDLDRAFVRSMQDNLIDLGARPERGAEWTRRMDVARLKTLSRLGLAEKLSNYQWRLDPDFENTLRSMGERGDIIRTYQKALKAHGINRESWDNQIYDSMGANVEPLLGKVLAVGVRDDVNYKAYLVIDGAQGRALYVDMGGADNVADIETGDIVFVEPVSVSPKQSDLTIAEIAARRGQSYSPAFHASEDPSASPDYIQAHVRRLEALRRAGHVKRNEDGSWKLPDDYIKRAEDFERQRQKNNPVRLRQLTRGSLHAYSQTMGRTWLDEELAHPSGLVSDKGYGQEINSALKKRLAYLAKEALILNPDAPVTDKVLAELERRDLSSAAKQLSQDIGKVYAQMPSAGRVEGVVRDPIDRPSGKYAVIEKAKEFTLAPWHDVLEVRRGMEISGQVRNGQINWELGRKRGLEIS